MASLKSALIKGSLVGAVGAVSSVLLLGGLESAPVFGTYLPKAFIHGVALAGSSVAATYAVPAIVPWVSAGSGQLKQFEKVVIEPLVLGAVFLGVESVLAPGAEVQGQGGTFKEIAVGTGSAIAASYIANGMGWVPNVLG